MRTRRVDVRLSHAEIQRWFDEGLVDGLRVDHPDGLRDPGKYLDETCGLRVDPDTRDGFIRGLTSAMLTLANSRDLRESMGKAARVRLSTHYFTCESKVQKALEIYQDVLAAERTAPQAA